MSDRFNGNRGGMDELGRDMVLAEVLEVLDPASQDPNYWFRFRGWVMTGAARELARRRLMAQLTVTDVLTSWGRTVVPTALLAAALAGIALLRAGDSTAQPIGAEVLVVDDVTLEAAPVLLMPEAARGFVAFATDEF